MAIESYRRGDTINSSNQEKMSTSFSLVRIQLFFYVGQDVPHFLINLSKVLFLVQMYFSVSNLILIFIFKNPAKLGSI